MVQVRFRGAREPRAEGVRRLSAKEAEIFPYLFAPAPRTLEGRSGNGSQSRPAEGPAARRAGSYPSREATEKGTGYVIRRDGGERQGANLANQVRVVMKGDQRWFVTKDACDILGIANPRDAIADFDDDEKGVVKTDTLAVPKN